jgi:hypothetical protein
MIRHFLPSKTGFYLIGDEAVMSIRGRASAGIRRLEHGTFLKHDQR